MTNDPITTITEEIESLSGTESIGMFTVKTANRTIADAALRPDPRELYHELWYEGEVCCLFSDSISANPSMPSRWQEKSP